VVLSFLTDPDFQGFCSAVVALGVAVIAVLMVVRRA
jgi:hypothetical protein